MNSHSRSSSVSINPQTSHHTSVTSRLSFAVSSAERGEAADGANAAAEHHQIEEEIAEIKRYEVSRLGLSTFWLLGRRLADSVLGFYNNRYDMRPQPIPPLVFSAKPLEWRSKTNSRLADWVQDAAREQLRRKARRKRYNGLSNNGKLDWRHKLWESYDAAQGWIVVTIIGAAIGLNAAFLNIVTEWLSDIKLGYCTTAFYLNENFCCWGEDNGMGFLGAFSWDIC